MKQPIEGAVDTLDQVLNDLRVVKDENQTSDHDLHIYKRLLLQHEAKRLESIYGTDSGRVQNIYLRLESNLEAINAIRGDKEVGLISVPEISDDSALVHGRIADENDRGIGKLTVCLLDEQSNSRLNSFSVLTEESGYFSIVLNAKEIMKVNCENSSGYFLTVFGSDSKILHQEKNGVSPVAGNRFLINISLDRNNNIDGDYDLCNQVGSSDDGANNEELVTVPNVAGQTESNAGRALRLAGLSVGEVQRVDADSPEVELRVVSQSSKFGSKIGIGDTVDIVMGVVEKATVPNLIGIKLSSAKRKLKESGLTVGKVDYHKSDNVEVIVAQEPEEGTELFVGVSVNIAVGTK